MSTTMCQRDRTLYVTYARTYAQYRESSDNVVTVKSDCEIGSRAAAGLDRWDREGRVIFRNFPRPDLAGLGGVEREMLR